MQISDAESHPTQKESHDSTAHLQWTPCPRCIGIQGLPRFYPAALENKFDNKTKQNHDEIKISCNVVACKRRDSYCFSFLLENSQSMTSWHILSSALISFLHIFKDAMSTSAQTWNSKQKWVKEVGLEVGAMSRHVIHIDNAPTLCRDAWRINMNALPRAFVDSRFPSRQISVRFLSEWTRASCYYTCRFL